MTKKEIQKRNIKADQLKVLQSDDGQFFVESSEGKILFKVELADNGNTCTCGDFARNIKNDSNFTCKHIISVMNALPQKDIENARFLEKLIPKLDDRFLTNIKGKDFVLYAGVLDLATQKGLLKLEVELIQFPSKENGNEAICRAVAVGKTGETFSDIGDANPKNCNSKIAIHAIRMASTRAKARCLRDMCNIGITALEEISDFDDVIGNDVPKKTTAKKTNSKKKALAKNDKTKTKSDEPVKETSKPDESKKVETKNTDNADTTQPKMSEAQSRAVHNLSRRRGISVEEIRQMAMEAFGCELENLSSKDAASFIRQLQQAA